MLHLVLKQPPVRSLSFATLFVIVLSALTLCVSTIASLVVENAEHRYLMQGFDSMSREKVKLLESATLDDIIAQDIPEVATTIAGFAKDDPDLRFIQITGADGTVLAHWVRIGYPAGDYHLTQRVAMSGESFGTLEANWDTERVNRQVGQHAGLIAMAIAIICSLMSGVSFALVRWIAIKPLNRFVDQLGKLRAGRNIQLEPMSRFSSTETRRLDTAINMLSDFMDKERRREAELAVARDAAIAANKVKSEFMANMSHELRTPLNAVIGFSSIMKEQLFGPIANERYSGYISDIHSSGEHLLALVNDILDISKVEAGKYELSEETINLKSIIARCLSLVRQRASEGGLQLIDSTGDKLPSIYVDRVKLKQVIINLISNAIKFTPTGGIVMLAIRHEEDGSLSIAIKDTGIGIAQKDLERVFEPFGRVDSSLTRSTDGTGLGLPLAKALIELHGGALTLNSKLGAGTEVIVTLPASRVVVDPSPGPRVIKLPQGKFAASEIGRTEVTPSSVVQLRSRAKNY